MSSLKLLCGILPIFYIGVILFGCFHLYSLIIREVASGRKFTLGRFTTQKLLHTLSVILCIVRLAFFITAFFYLDSEHRFHAQNDLEYILHLLDEISKILFVSLMSLVILFWADVYFHAIDEVASYNHTFTKFLVIALNSADFVGLAYCTVYDVDNSSTTNYTFVVHPFAFLMALIFIIVALCIGYFTSAANFQLQQVPVALEVRQTRSAHIQILGSILVAICVLNATVLVLLDRRHIYASNHSHTHSQLFLAALALYFIVLEIVPLLLIQWFYRANLTHTPSRLSSCPSPSSSSGKLSPSPDENTPLSAGEESEERDVGDDRWSTHAKRVRNYDRGVPAPIDLIEDVVKRLSRQQRHSRGASPSGTEDLLI